MQIQFVTSIEDIKKNMKTLDNYLSSDDKDEVIYAKKRVKMGTCFIAVHTENGFRFYPSRFIGYAENTMDKHERNYEKDGTQTNPAISQILGASPKPNTALENEYQKYCESLGVTSNKAGAFGAPRKYWVFPEND